MTRRAKPKIPEVAKEGKVVLTAKWEPLYDPEQGLWFEPGKSTPAFITRLVSLWLGVGAVSVV